MWLHVLKIGKHERKMNIDFLHMKEPIKTTVSGRFSSILDRNSIKYFALTHVSTVYFVIESKFEVNWTVEMLKNA